MEVHVWDKALQLKRREAMEGASYTMWKVDPCC